MNSRLRTIQNNFAEALLRKTLANSDCDIFSGDASISEGRLRFYRGNIRAIWGQTLTNTYPVIRTLVGDDFFEILSSAYGREFPSQSGDLNQFGMEFSAFLDGFEQASDYPYFSAVAALEWQLHTAYYADDDTELSLPQFLAEAGESAQESQLRLHNACTLYKAPYASVAIWLAHQDEERPTLDMEINCPSFALITRSAWRVEMLPLDESGYQALSSLSKGMSLGDALEVAMQINSYFNVSTQLQAWFQRGAFSSHKCKK
jgi:hypothetical protein